jgi:hypothetical protein
MGNTDTNMVVIWRYDVTAKRDPEIYVLIEGFVNFMVFAGIMYLTFLIIMITIQPPTLDMWVLCKYSNILYVKRILPYQVAKQGRCKYS